MLLELTGKAIPEVIVLGAQPFELNAGVELSLDMKKILPPIVDRAIEILRAWNVDVRVAR